MLLRHNMRAGEEKPLAVALYSSARPYGAVLESAALEKFWYVGRNPGFFADNSPFLFWPLKIKNITRTLIHAAALEDFSFCAFGKISLSLSSLQTPHNGDLCSLKEAVSRRLSCASSTLSGYTKTCFAGSACTDFILFLAYHYISSCKTDCLEYNRKPGVGAPMINALFKGMLASARAQRLMHFDKYLPRDQHRFLDQNATVEDRALQYHHCECCKNRSLSAKWNPPWQLGKSWMHSIASLPLWWCCLSGEEKEWLPWK